MPVRFDGIISYEGKYMTAKEQFKTTLLNLLENYSADDITIKMLCLESGLSKQTFYYHYANLEDVLGEAFRDVHRNQVKKGAKYREWSRELQRFLEFLCDKKKVCLHLYDSSLRAFFLGLIEECARGMIANDIDRCSEEIDVFVTEQDKNFMVQMYTHALMGLVDDFMNNRMKDDPAYCASRCDAMLHLHVKNTLRTLNGLEEEDA